MFWSFFKKKPKKPAHCIHPVTGRILKLKKGGDPYLSVKGEGLEPDMTQWDEVTDPSDIEERLFFRNIFCTDY